MNVSTLKRVPEPDSSAELVPFKTVCRRLHIHYNTGYKLRREDRFPLEVLSLGDRFFCRRDDLERYAHRATA